ncbi:Alpha/Beta hydrolase protein [Limtongia smithiae]|uniref:Alpha/Beta hydrolase protein n=1 Tax=Limtongia smithiae TaxID=1125753 RepID=UPI0034CEB1EF
MASTEPCDVIPSPQFTAEYTPKGNFTTVEGREVYFVGNIKASYAVICIYDIFGMHPNTFQGADYLALSTIDGPLVVMPDFFAGKPVTDDISPSVNPDAFQAWRATNSAENHMPYLEAVIAWITTTYPDIKTVGLYGFCWGGKFAIMGAKLKLVNAVAMVHPSRIVELDASGVEDVPILVVASKNETVESLAPFVEKLNTVQYIRYDDMHHGYAAARGDWSVPEQKARAQETFKIMNDFFHKYLLA